MRKKLIGTLLVIPFVFSLMMVNAAKGCPDNTMYIDPPVIWDPRMAIGTEFSVNICVDYVRKLMLYQFVLVFNPSVLHGVSVENGPFLGSAGGHVEIYPGPGFDNEKGYLYLFMAAVWPGPYPTGGGVLATVTFRKVGDGSSPIHIGVNSALWTLYGWYTGPHQDGFFSNEPGPELYVCTRGASSWPAWRVGTAGDTQTLYCKIMNYGAMGADVYVDFVVTGAGEVKTYTSNADTIAAAQWIAEELVPAEVTVSTSFTSGPPGKYRVMAVLYFRAGPLTNYVAYYLFEDIFGGKGVSREIPHSFKTV